MTKWNDIFAPVLNQGRSVREGQTLLGQEVINVISHGGSLLGEAATGTGKSLAYLVPMIDAIQSAKKHKKEFKCVVSTETITLQTQIFEKDIPFLQGLYKGFNAKKLLGRSNYLCYNVATISARGNRSIEPLVHQLKTAQNRLTTGERSDVEKIVGRELTPEEWGFIAGSSKFCGDNQCNTEHCYSALARAEAFKADLVIVNHALLAVDAEMKASSGDGAFADGLLGQIDVLAVDEGHQLEPVLVSQWTQEITDWELRDKSSAIAEAIDNSRGVVSDSTIDRAVNTTLQDIEELLKNVMDFHEVLCEKSNERWERYTSALSQKFLPRSTNDYLLRLMKEYEETNPVRLEKAEKTLERAIKYLTTASAEAKAQKTGNVRKINKGLRCSKELLEAVKIISKALETKDGIVQQYGAFGCSVKGWKRRDGRHGMTIRLVPLDVSTRAKYIWSGVRTNILLSATLTDLTDNSFNYARDCIGFPAGKEIKVSTPFALETQQLIYVTQANREQVEGAQYSFSELVDLLNISRGRALVLFTSREELDWASYQMLQLKASGKFTHKILVQERDSNKQKLAEEFKSDVHSVLFATKSFFTGFDASGETLSLVAICKFPMAQYSVECKQQITHWRKRGYPKWYERESLTVLQQAAGRLIRSDGCKGVVSLLDFRLMNTGSNIYKTAHLGVQSLKSPVTQDLNQVKEFLK